MILGSYPLGTTTLGGALATTATAAAPSLDLELYIAGTERSDYLMHETLRVTEELNLRGDATFRLFDADGNLHVRVGETVRITFRGVVIFAGIVEGITEQVPDGTGALYTDVDCVDFNQLLDRHLVTTVFPAGLTLRNVVSQIVDTYSGDIGERLSDEGIRYTVASLPDGPELGRVVFNRLTAAECLNRLCELVGFAWWVDSGRILHVRDSAANYGPAPLNPLLHGAFGQVRYQSNLETYRNLQYIEGGQTRTEPVYLDTGSPNPSVRAENFVGDGQTKTWNLSLPVAEKPRIIVDGLEVLQSQIAIQEKDPTALWYYQLEERQISQNSDDAYAAVPAGNSIQVLYAGYYPVVQLGRSDDEIRDRQSIEGGTGIYSQVRSDESIDDAELAREYAQALLRRYGRIPSTITARTTTAGYHAGQLVPVVLPEHQALRDYLLERLDFSFLGWDDEEPFVYTLQLASGEHQGGWADYYRRLSLAGRPFTITDNDILRILRGFRDKLHLSDVLRVDQGDTLSSWTVDRFSRYLLGASRIGRARAGGFPSGPRLGLPDRI